MKRIGIGAALAACAFAFSIPVGTAFAQTDGTQAPFDDPIQSAIVESLEEAMGTEIDTAESTLDQALATMEETQQATQAAEDGQAGASSEPSKGAASPSTAASAAEPDQEPQASHSASTVSFAGTTLSFVDDYEAASAPSSGAGLWLGSDSTTDGSWGYFIGHNPGPFHGVMGLGVGDAVTVCDRDGQERTYHVVDTFTVPDTTCWEDIAGRVTGYGESIALQTCVGDGANYRIVVAD